MTIGEGLATEMKKKKSGRIWLIILLVMFNSVPIYLILDQLNRYVP